MLNERQINIARHLALSAFQRRRTTYRDLAQAIGWHHPFGRGLGNDLWEVLNFTWSRGLPCLTSILVEGGTRSPPAGAIDYIRSIYGPMGIQEHQAQVFAFDWGAIPEFEFESAPTPEINFDRVFATRTWGFDPENWGMSGFSAEVTREKILAEMGDEPIYVVYFCGQQRGSLDSDSERFTVDEGDLARALGVVEVQPMRATHDTHTSPDARKQMLEDWGRFRWPFGLANSRAWELVDRPWTKTVLPTTRSASWEATRGIVPITDEEKDLLRRERMVELPVFGQEKRAVAIVYREPMHTTYLALCRDSALLAKTNAPPGTTLVKIGVSGDTSRRLRDLNDHHYAKIFGLSFQLLATHRWPKQAEALAREAAALEWALDNSIHASGEYFFMTESQVNEALMKVKPVRR